MSRMLYMAWRYVVYNKVKSAILAVCLMLTAAFPFSAYLLIAQYGDSLTARARATPLVVGAKGNRFDLALKSLYFGSAPVDAIRMAEVESIRESGLAAPIPLHLRFSARGYPIVGTTLDYFEFRGLKVALGTGLHKLGQAVLGAEVAEELGIGPGDSLFSDQCSLYDISRTYPLKMRVVGVLARSDSPDDDAVFVDIKTAWIIEGITHGHQDVVKTMDPSQSLARTDEKVVTDASIVEYNEVTAENIGSFHTHAEPGDLPLSAVIVVPRDRKSGTLIKARYQLSTKHSMLVPAEVVDELMGLVFKVKRFFDANLVLITGSTVLFLVLIVLLSRRIRRREMETLFKIGCGRSTALGLQAAELAIVVVIGLGAAGVLATTVTMLAPRLVRWM